MPLRLSMSEWKQIVKWFILEQSSNKISQLSGISKQRVLRALNAARITMTKDIPGVFSGIVEVDETYLGGQWKNKRKKIRQTGTKRGRGTSKQPVFGIYCRNGKVWAEIVDDIESETLLPLIEKRVRKKSVVCSDTWKGYTGIAGHGYVHRMVKHSDGEFSDGKGTHINGLEGFWGYLKRKLASKGGIRKERLWLYLGEYVWRYNNRTLTVNQQVSELMKLIKNRRMFVGRSAT